MSNSAYLTCVGDGADGTKELYAEYSLPDGWALLFAPEDLHVGHPREHAEAGSLFSTRDRETTSYLLATAEVALARFATRLKNAGVAMTGKGTVAKVHTWLSKHMAKGWLFADTSELEWMQGPGEVVAAMRKALASAHVPHLWDPSADVVLTTFGSGTGLSTEEKAREKERKGAGKQSAARLAKQNAAIEIAEARKAPVDVSTLEGRPFSIRESFTVGEQIAHPVFKTGTVTSATATTITVDFPTGSQLLAHQRK
ncbi:MAG TPA: hypothetical protein VGM90_01795 [Kofleriaceae bacterium]